jgi:hypothetical protein
MRSVVYLECCKLALYAENIILLSVVALSYGHPDRVGIQVAKYGVAKIAPIHPYHSLV